MTEPLAYSQAEAAALLGVSVSTFQRHVRPELPTPVFVGGRLIFKRADLERWLARQ